MAALFTAEAGYALLDRDISREEALAYFQKNVTGKHKDVYGNTIVIKPNDYHFLFNKHNPKSGMLLRYKARRLSWVLPTLEKSHRVRVQKRGKQINIIYLAYVAVPNFILGVSSYTPEYYCVILRDIKYRLCFVTAYPLHCKQYHYMCDNLPSYAD